MSWAVRAVELLKVVIHWSRYEYVQCVPGEGAEPLTVPASSVEGFDALILLAATFTAKSIPSDGRLKLVARFGVGFDNVDVEACSAAGIAVTITPDGVRRPVAVTVVNFLLSLASKLRAKERLARTNDWGSRSEYMGVGVTNKTLGLLGLGNIGAEICKLIHPFDVNTIAYDPYVDDSTAKAVGVELVDLDTLFARSDFLSVNCPLNDATLGLVNAARFSQMKDSAYVYCYLQSAIPYRLLPRVQHVWAVTRVLLDPTCRHDEIRISCCSSGI